MDAIAVVMLVGLGWIFVLGLVVMLCVSASNGDRVMLGDTVPSRAGAAGVVSRKSADWRRTSDSGH